MMSSTLTFTPSGGRRAWKRGDEERAFAAAKFAEHRYRELGLEVAMIKKYVASLNSNNTTKASVAATLMKRVLTFPSGGRYTNNRSGALANLLLAQLWVWLIHRAGLTETVEKLLKG